MIPPPSYAATVWLSGQTLNVAMESPVPDARGNMVCFPADEYGIKCLLQVLREREKVRSARTIGHKSEPTQYDLDAIYRAMKQNSAKPQPKLPANIMGLLRKNND